ncbi:MAG: nuclear transport factor 2 family protein [Defluviitaleaceae bacterium]|nr:nuclear transport factor 2 family protein [Defluviitaleaceae bacterium]
MDTKQVKKVLQRYFDAFYNVDINELSALFHESIHIYGYDENGKLEVINKKGFLKILSSFRPNSENPEFIRSDEILAIDFISEDVVVARVKLRFYNSICTDIVNMMRIDGEWNIICILDSRANICD